MRKRLSTSTYTFRKIITENGMYVDKTKELYQLVNKLNGQFFLSSPRRFGKSMTISTLESIFLGEKGLFKGLYIYDQKLEWKKHPIIRLSMNSMSADSVEDIETNLSIELKRIARRNNIELETKKASQRFKELIVELYDAQGQVVILIDEYDKPILDNVLNTGEVQKIRTLLKQFYGMIKASEEYLRFTFITGVSKFTQVSIFSDLNNLTDITLHPDFATICGFTQTESEHYFKEWIDENCGKLGMTRDDYLAKIKENYDGIRFSRKESYVYNPVSFTRAMADGYFDHYWFETGTPTFLLKMLKEKLYDQDGDRRTITDLEHLVLPADAFSSYEVDNLKIEPILFQTGYLTIKDYNPDSQLYTLSYPNKEVRSAFVRRLADYFSFVGSEVVPSLVEEIREAFLNDDMDKVFKVLKVFYSQIDNSIKIKQEKYYQSVFYILFTLLGYRIKAEVNTNDGRMDAVIFTDDLIYIIEFKLEKTAAQAIDQIREKEYFNRFLLDKRPLKLIGVQFNTENGTIKEWIVEQA